MSFDCPNQPPCGHFLHDIYEPGDPYPTCCAEGCRCGHPGTAEVERHANGTVTVVRADPVIRVTRELLEQVTAHHFDGETFTLDTAGEHRYEYLRPDPADGTVAIFGRAKP